MNETFNKNAKVEKFTTMLGTAVRLIVKDPLIEKSNTYIMATLLPSITIYRSSLFSPLLFPLFSPSVF